MAVCVRTKRCFLQKGLSVGYPNAKMPFGEEGGNELCRTQALASA